MSTAKMGVLSLHPQPDLGANNGNDNECDKFHHRVISCWKKRGGHCYPPHLLRCQIITTLAEGSQVSAFKGLCWRLGYRSPLLGSPLKRHAVEKRSFRAGCQSARCVSALAFRDVWWGWVSNPLRLKRSVSPGATDKYACYHSRPQPYRLNCGAAIAVLLPDGCLTLVNLDGSAGCADCVDHLLSVGE